MNKIRQNGAVRTAHARTTHTVAPISRAIRAALTVSATMLTLFTPVASWAASAGTSSHDAAGNAFVSKSAFSHTLPVASFIAPVDLTTVVDDQLPTSVHPDVGQVGIEADWASIVAAADSAGRAETSGGAGRVHDVTVVHDDDAFAGNASAILVSAVHSDDTTVHYSGVDVSGYGYVAGIVAYDADSSTVETSGGVSVNASATAGIAAAYGVFNTSNHLAFVNNDGSGSIIATAHSQDGGALALGVYLAGGDAATLNNYGAIFANASSTNGSTLAYAVVAQGYNSLINNGSVGDLNASASAGAGASAQAGGASVNGNVASIYNAGNISAAATAGHGGSASATAAHATGANASIYTYGDLSATATTVGGLAKATGAYAYGTAGSTFYNAGDITVSAVADYGMANAVGAESVGFDDSDATNTGTISATASGGQASAIGLLNHAYSTATTINTGRISVVADGTLAPYGQYEAVATGIYTLAALGDAVIDNSGAVTVSSSATADIGDTSGWLVAHAIGVRAVNPYGQGEALIDNSGSISASAVTGHGYASAWGAVVQAGSYGYGDAEIDNDGSISSSATSGNGSSVTIGAYVHSGNTATIVNHGDITATSQAEVSVPNASLAAAYATGAKVYGFAYGTGGARVSNYGNIEADSSVEGEGGFSVSTALQISGSTSSIYNAQGASILATADTGLFGSAKATAIEASGVYGIDVVNDGNITAYARARAYNDGVYNHYGLSSATGVSAVANYRGNVSVVNNGDIQVHAVATNGISFFNAGAGATGVSTYAKYNAVVENSGSISAIANSELGDAAAYGVIGRSKYYSHVSNDAGASIVATATTGSLSTDQYGGRAISFGTHSFGNGSSAVTYNAGSIISYAEVTADGGANEDPSNAKAWGASIGAYSFMKQGSVISVGDIEATAKADFGYATSFGTYVRSAYDSTTSNTGTIESSAAADNGDAFAVGSYVFALHSQYIVDCSNGYCDYSTARFVPDSGTASLDNSGQITAVAMASGGTGHAYGATVLGAFVTGITNSGHISASVDADNAYAFGVLANSAYGYATLQNSGSISAVATGDIASASGAFVAGAYGNNGNGYQAVTVDNQGTIVGKATGSTSATAVGLNAVGWKDGGVQIDNAGTIAAAAYGTGATATAVLVDSHGSVVLNNTGSIGAYGDGARIAVATGADATATIVNAGTMIGAITTGDLDDSVDNAAGANWHAVDSSDFGAGDDHVVNHGTLFMDDAEIKLGSYVNGNTFDNFGTINVLGDSNTIDMDNPFPVTNNGAISFVNGIPNDVLNIVGNFAGQGSINVDVSGTHQTSDQLHVQGNVLGSTKQAINVNLLDMPTTPTINIPVVTASGTLGGTFTLGQVQQPRNGFVSMDFGLKTTSSTTSLAVDVTGLTSMGSLAADLAPGIQSLVNSEVGTWHQRMGVVPEQRVHGVAAWVRTFSDSGDMNPQGGTNFGVGGNGEFHQTNQGTELGLDIRLADHLSAGVLAGTSTSNQTLTGGAGSDHIDGNMYGIYGTWVAQNSFYVDVSQRWTSIRAHLRSTTATPGTDASVATFNAEAGFTAWTVAGVHVVPQLQYTHTRIDSISPLYSQGETFTNQAGVSSRGRLGIALDKTIQGGSFSWTPYGSINAVREFNGKSSYAIDGGLQGSTSTGGTSAMIELGLGASRGGFSVTGGVNWTDGGALQNVLGGQVLLRYNW